MTDAVVCDSCGEAAELTEYNSGLRCELNVQHLSAAATSHTDTSWDLCESCTAGLLERADIPFPRGFDPADVDFPDADPWGDTW